MSSVEIIKMHPKTIKYTYLEWLSTDEMHEASLRWFSELKFMRDEQMFFNNLVTSYTLQLVDSRVFDESKQVIAKLQKAEKDIVPLFKKVQAHENQLEIMLDDVEQPKMEKAYIDTHKELLIAMQAYMETYREIKDRLFKVVSEVIKKGKQKRLLN